MNGPQTAFSWVEVQDYSASNQLEWTADDTDEGLTSVLVFIKDQVTKEKVSGTYSNFEVQVQ